MVQISQTESCVFRFPPGHPRVKSLYVAHPAMPSVYYSAASFHRMAFEHKFSEVINLLMSLGASSIKVTHLMGWSREFAARLSTPLSGVEATAKAMKATEENSSLLFVAILNNNCTPKIPDHLVWYEHEPTWQSIANGRINHGLSTISLTVDYRDDYRVNGSLKVDAEKAGFDLGGDFEDYRATIWKIEGAFETPAI